MLAHAPPQEILGERGAVGAEPTEHAAVDEALVRLVGGHLRLDVPVFRRGALVDPRLVLLDRGELVEASAYRSFITTCRYSSGICSTVSTFRIPRSTPHSTDRVTDMATTLH
jgi:hypothetical protein